MKWSTTLSLFAALPLALGGVIEAPHAIRRGNHGNGHANIDPSAIAAEFIQDSHQANQHSQNGQGEHIVTHVVILWVNPGADATTTKMASTVIVENAPPANTHTVLVGGEAGLVFVPESLSASVGDTVHFVFLSQNHTVTQSTFDTPCKKMDGGIDSGFMPNPDNSVVPPPMMAVQVTTEKPLCKSSSARY